MPQKIEVGKRFPQQLTIKDGLAIQPMPSGLMALIHLSSFEKSDKNALAGPVSIAVHEAEEHLPWVALRFHKNGLCLDVPIIVGHRPTLQEHLKKSGNGLQVVVLKGGHHVVTHLRVLGLSDEVLDALKNASGQKDALATRHIRPIQKKYPTSEMIYEAASIKQHFQ